MKKLLLFFTVLLFVLGIFSKAQSLIPEEVQTNIRNHVASNAWGQLYYDVLPKIIRKYKIRNVLEVGVALGGHAETLLRYCDIDNYYGIDPYKCFDPNDAFSSAIQKYSPNESPQQNFDYLYTWVKEVRLNPYAEKCHLIRKSSVEASALFQNNSLDCIFIDGDHRYEAVMEDLRAWFPKLKPRGVLCGDDYWQPQVAKAVEDYFSLENKRVFFFTAASGYKIWAIIK